VLQKTEKKLIVSIQPVVLDWAWVSVVAAKLIKESRA
jgi:hypothetical protein